MDKSVAAIVLVICLNSVLVCSKPPDWIDDDMLAMVMNDKKRCMGEHGTTEELIDKVNGGVIENDRALTCYMHCLFEAFSIVDEDGDIETELLIGIMPENLQGAARPVLEKCTQLKGSDGCDMMYQIAKCVQAERPDLWFMV